MGYRNENGVRMPQRSDADCVPLTKIFEDHAEQRKSLERPGVIEIKDKKRKVNANAVGIQCRCSKY